MKLKDAYCPMGCGSTLAVVERGDGDTIACESSDCPQPDAAARVLADQETEHIVEVGETNFSLQHPLRERLNGDLFDCPVQRWLKAQEGPPVEPGRYRMIDEGDPAAGYYFEPVES